MAKEHENISLAPDETFRLLRWTSSVNRVEVIRRGQTRFIAGHGDHWHYHRAMELTLIKHGTGTRFVADRVEMFHDGDLVLIGANVPHYWHSDGRYTGLSVQWDFPPDHGIWRFGEMVVPLQTLARSALHGLRLKGKTAIATANTMAALTSLADLPRLAAFLQLISSIASAPGCDVEQLAVHPFSLNGTAERQEEIARAVSYILAHYRESVRLDELLRLTGMSRATFARQFQRHAGKTFSAFLNEVRLQAVCRALMESADSISSIAFNHGFNQLSFFNRLFRREFGMSPSDYRRKLSRPL